ncbi:hypothetical protein B0H14DRAFT_2656442 [Mycena olivaceomarginata]|nr:hypothetical protein B0H14DRAFT_2656442 [Mycena olivaceomarginata]
MVAGGQVCGMAQVGGTAWVQVAGTWNGWEWQARGMDGGGWVAAYRAGDWYQGSYSKVGQWGTPQIFRFPPAAAGAPHLKEVWGGPHPVFAKCGLPHPKCGLPHREWGSL